MVQCSRIFAVSAALGLAACASMSRPPPASAQASAVNPLPTAPPTAREVGEPWPATHDAGASSDPGGDADFAAARAEFEAGNRTAARQSLARFLSVHGQHPARGQAVVMLARLALAEGDAETARAELGPLVKEEDAAQGAKTPDAGIAVPSPSRPPSAAHYYLGLAELRVGHPKQAKALLMPFLPAPGSALLRDGDEMLVEIRGALAEAETQLGEAPAAIELWDAYARGAREPEKLYARQRAAEVAGKLSGEGAWRAYAAAPAGGLGRAVLGPKAAAYLRSQGDANGAAAIESDVTKARRAAGFEDGATHLDPGDPSRFGLLAPLSGKLEIIGEATLRAAMLATGAPGAGPSSIATLALRDSAGDPERAASGTNELARSEAVIGALTAANAKTNAAAVAAAARAGLPLAVLDDKAPGPTSTAFQMLHAPETRARALARQALALGARQFAVLGPDNALGKRLREAFRDEVSGGGGRITAEATYLPSSTSFGPALASLKRSPPEAVFVADGADKLELVAPALAFADLWAVPWSQMRGPKRDKKAKTKGILLLSTAHELSPKLLQNAGRYVQGALLCPGFYASESDARAQAFVTAYRSAYGQEPHAAEAYAYDAFSLFRVATERGARTRAQVLATLGGKPGTVLMQGLTGNITFGPDHARSDAPVVYVVEGEVIRASR
jgi:branched-chain amino acid transport system substrate-binding protein